MLAAVAAMVGAAAAAVCEYSADHAALLALHAGNGGDAWAPEWQWPVEFANHCAWAGIACEDGCVVELVQRGGVRGQLPDALGDLAALRELELYGLFNDITGTLPAGLSRLSKLEILQLGRNAITGNLAAIEALPALRECYLHNNAFTGPIRVGGMPNLWWITYNDNAFSSTIDPAFGDLDINTMVLSDNQLTGTIPLELGALTNTRILLSGNSELEGPLPEALVGLDGVEFDGTAVTVGCPAAMFYSSSGRCQPCDPGTTTTDGNYASECERCPPGTSQEASTGALACPPCAIGTFSSDGLACRSCPPGAVAPITGANACITCPAGTISNAAGAGCDACPAGWSTDGAEGALMCLPCAAGSVAAASAASCTLCEPGTFAPEMQRTVCEPCPAGSTTDGAAGATACVPCPTGSVAGAGNATCTLCAPGSFAAAQGLARCALCAAGTHQPETGGTECPMCRYPRRCLEGNTCAKGYAGAGCLFCAANHFQLNNVCLSCPVVPWPLFVLVGLGAALVYAASRRRLGARQTTVLKILFFYVQMVVVALAIQVQWPASQTGFVEAMSFASAEIGLPLAECYVSVGWYAGFAWSLAGPVAVMAAFWAAALVAEWRRHRRWAADEDIDRDFALMAVSARLRRLWIAASAAMHLPLVRVLLTAFDCENDAEGRLVVAGSDDGTRCDTGTHAAVQTVSALALAAIGLVMPAVAMWFVLRLRRANHLDKASVQAAWGGLYESYRPEYCFLEGVVAVRKLVLTATLVVPGIDAGTTSWLLAVQSICWALFVFVRRPFVVVQGGAFFGLVRRRDLVNELEIAASVVVALHQGVAGLSAAARGGVVWAEAGVLLLVITVALLLVLVFQLVRMDRGNDVTPAGFSLGTVHQQQKDLYRDFMLALSAKDMDTAERLRAEGVRHAKQSREFAAWRQDRSQIAQDTLPFLEMVIAEEDAVREDIAAAAAAIGPASAASDVVKVMATAAMAGYFDLARAALAQSVSE